MVRLKTFRILLALTVAVASLVASRQALAADSTTPAPPTVVTQDRNDHNSQHDLRGVPDSLKFLISAFDQTRDKYLEQQRLLQAKLNNASTPAERNQIRQQLQANRQEFLADLKSFRQELSSDLQSMKGKISHAEFGRIIDASHAASTEGGHRHRGQ